MRGNAVARWWQKDGSTENEYEDAYAVGAPGCDDSWQLTDDALRVAVADGATESMLSGRWARSLVRTYADSQRMQLRGCVFRAVSGWPQSLKDYKEGREQAGRPISWYEEPGLERGAHATLLVAEFRSEPGGQTGTWLAEAVGDSCLFQVSDGVLTAAFPLEASVEFGSSPALVHTGLRKRRLLDRHRATRTGTWTSGDTFFLCTDALAEWFLSQHESAAAPWLTWRDLPGPEEFRGWVADERRAGRLKNDDVTLVTMAFD